MGFLAFWERSAQNGTVAEATFRIGRCAPLPMTDRSPLLAH